MMVDVVMHAEVLKVQEVRKVAEINRKDYSPFVSQPIILIVIGRLACYPPMVWASFG